MSGLAKEVKNSTKTTIFPTSLLLLCELLGGVLLLVELLLVAVVVGETVATVAASEMVAELVVLQRVTKLLFDHPIPLFYYFTHEVCQTRALSLLYFWKEGEKLNRSSIPGRSLRCMG